MKNKLNLLAISFLSIPVANAATSSCGSAGTGCTYTDNFDSNTNTHNITLEGDPSQFYGKQISLATDHSYKITNNANLNQWFYKIFANGGQFPKSVEIINNGKLLSNNGQVPENPDAGATSSVEIYWGRLKDNFSLVNYGEIGTTGLGSNERAVAVVSDTQANYKLDNLGKDSLIRANAGQAVYLDGANSIEMNNEGTILSRKSNGLVAESKTLSFTNSGLVKTESTNHYSAYIIGNNSLNFTNTGTLDGIFRADSSEQNTIVNSGKIISEGTGTARITGKTISFTNNGHLAKSANSSAGHVSLRMTASESGELILLSQSKIDGLVQAKGTNDTLILKESGTESNLLNNRNKFQEFEHFKMQGDSWTLTDNFTFSQTASAESGTLNLKQGSLTAPSISVGNSATLKFFDDYSLKGNVANSGTLDFDHSENPLVFKNLTVTGDYVGNDGLLKLYADFDGLTNKTDMLLVKGNATGTTRVFIKHIGAGAENQVNGVKIIETASSPDTAFSMDPLAKGAFSYNLEKRHESNQDNWYLTSYKNGTPTIRPDFAGYANNLYAANNLFGLRLEDRLGRDHFLNQSPAQDIWLRVVHGTNRNQMEDTQNSTKSHRTLVQIGGDVVQMENYKIGAMFGYGKQHSDITSTRDLNANAKISGYSVGLYGTWGQMTGDKSGPYIDSWLQYQWFRNQVNNETYRAKGFSASVETGYHVAFTPYQVQDWEHRFGLQPQAQIIWQGVKANEHTDQTDTTFVSKGHNNIQTRLGVKVWLDSHLTTQHFNIKPYVELNWIHNTKSFKASVGNIENAIQGTKNLMEYKGGIETSFGPNTQIWTAFAHQRGTHNYKDNQLNVGVKFVF